MCKSLTQVMWPIFALPMLFYASVLLTGEMAAEIVSFVH